MHYLRLIAVGVLVSIVVAGCGGSSAPVSHPDGAKQVAAGTDGDGAYPTAGMYTDFSSYLDFMENPGEPYVDYHPERILVKYLPLKRSFADLPEVDLPLSERASEQPWSVLRKNRQYEAITDAIASTYNIGIRHQAYIDDLNVASFELIPGTDGDALLERLRMEFSEYVEFAAFSQGYQVCEELFVNDPDYTGSTADDYGPLWGMHKIRCGEAWTFTIGDPGTYIAVCDTGVRLTHEELTETVLDPETDFSGLPPDSYFNTVDENNDVSDGHGHGTFIAGQMNAAGNNGRTIIGVAFNTRCVPVKIAGDDGTSWDDDMIAGCLLAQEAGAKAINVSFGDTHTNPAIETMINTLWDNGSLFVAAAGNEGVDTPHYPSDYETALSVGATDPWDAKLDFSNYSAGVDMAAPGAGIKSCAPTSDTAYADWQTSGGTSYACPLVAAAAGLLWSYNPALSPGEVRNLLESTGAPTTGFTNGTVPRLDIAEALNNTVAMGIEPPDISRMIVSGLFNLSPEVTGEPESVECFVNGAPYETKTAAPWDFAIDTTSQAFGNLEIELVATSGQSSKTAEVNLIVDNTTGGFPVNANFETPALNFTNHDPRAGTSGLLTELKTYPGPGEFWTVDDIRGGGEGSWKTDLNNPYEGSKSMYCGDNEGSYGNYIVPCLVSRKIDLTSAENPTMVYYQRYNIEDGDNDFDRGVVYATEDNGQTFTLLQQHVEGDYTDALYSGDQPDWERVEIDLSPLSGSMVNIVFLLETDGSAAGETDDFAGWWIDNISIATDYEEGVPTIGVVSLPAYTLTGAVPGVGTVNASVSGVSAVSRMTFRLNYTVYGSSQPVEIMEEVTSAPFAATLNIPVDVHNQEATLQIRYYNSQDEEQDPVDIPLYIFNQRGDANLDGVVDDLDLDQFDGLLGITNEDPSYLPFLDSNLDGVIDGRDVAAVGYHYGAGAS